MFILAPKRAKLHLRARPDCLKLFNSVCFCGCAFLQPMLCPLPQTALTGTRVSPSSALPGDTLNSVVDPRFRRDPPVLSTKEPSSVSFLDSLQQKKKKKKVFLHVFLKRLWVFVSV